MKTLLLTGIGGSIGIHAFCHIMNNTDWRVVGIDSFRHKGLTDRLAVVLDDHPDWRERLKVITHDLTAPFSEMTIGKMGPVDYIISMASLSDVQASIDDPVPFVRHNVNVMLTMLELAKALKPDAFIQISTDEVYGPAERKGQHPEWSPILPSNPYSGSKAAQEALCVAWWRTYNVPLVIINLMNNFGPLQQGNKFPVMVQRAVMEGTTVKIHGTPGNIGTRFYIHSRNSADALLFILRNVTPNLHEEGKLDRPARFNIVGDAQLDNLELAQTIAKMLGKELKWEYAGASDSRPGHDADYGLTGDKLKNLGWTAPVSFEQSMADTLEWQSQNPEWMKV